MIGFFRHFNDKAQHENIDENAFNSLCNELEGIVFLDTSEEAEKNKEEIEKLNTGLTFWGQPKLDLTI
jgi:hypothetical protein